MWVGGKQCIDGLHNYWVSCIPSSESYRRTEYKELRGRGDYKRDLSSSSEGST
ncbi:hypothetical protein HanRHA438_Chr10g0451671 [Helianthus annuus]|nr:hypothetical protein HanRHA438_Chr10g0451671 [Helianthus annuus]